MITSIIFSKDRPLQLDLCLNSIRTNFRDTNRVVVIEKYSEGYTESLETLKSEHPDVVFVKQSDSIYRDIMDVCAGYNKYTCFFTDDNIVFGETSFGSALDRIFGAPGVNCISLRLGNNITVRYHHGNKLDQHIGPHQIIEDYIFVPKTLYPYGNYWSYSHSVDGHIFRTEEVLDMFSEIELLNQHFHYKQTPNEVETQMQRYWTISGNFIVCLPQSTVVNSPNNRVSDTHTENFSGEHFMYGPEFLLGKYLSGKRIALSLLDFSDISCPHQELNIIEALA